MTPDTVGQFLQMYWPMVLFCLGLIWHLVKMHFTLLQMKQEIKGLREQADHHDKADQKMQDELSNQIERNKVANETLMTSVQNQLSALGRSMARLEGLAELLTQKFVNNK